MSSPNDEIAFKDQYKHKFDFLLKAIDDAQNTIRFTDAKAGAVIGFWGIIITVITRYNGSWIEWLKGLEGKVENFIVFFLILLMILFFIKSFWLAYMVIVPKFNPNGVDKSSIDIKGLFFLAKMNPNIEGKYLYNDYPELQLGLSTQEYITMMKDTGDADLHNELIVELQKVSFIRNVKIARANKAISSILNFLITTFVLILLLLGIEFFPQVEGVKSISMSVDVQLFIILYIGHKIGDYLLQTDRQARLKAQEWEPLITHSIVYTTVTLGMAYLFTGFFSWYAIIIVLGSHILLDHRKFLIWWAKKIKKIHDPSSTALQTTMMELDQSFHYLVLFIVSCLFQ